VIPPQELQNKSFTRAMRGYDPAEVDEYMNFVIGKYSEIFKQCEIYDKKLRIVSQKIVEIQDRENDLQGREDIINKTVISSQRHHDKIVSDAEEAAAIIIENAERAAEKVLADARERAQTALSAIDRKLNMQIDSTQEKADALLLSARTRCTRLLSDFKKEISHQRENIINLKNMADSFSENLIAMYKHQLTFVTDSFYVPSIDFEKFTETQLFDMVMKELRSDAIDIAKKNGDIEYDFERELELLRNTEFINEYDEYNYKTEKEVDIKGENSDEDIKVFPRKNVDGANTPNNGGSNTDIADNTAEESKEADVSSTTFNKAGTAEESEEREGQEEDEEQDDYVEEEPIATYDSDDYDENQYNNNYNARGNANNANNYNRKNSGGYGVENEESDELDETDEEIESKAKGFFGLFKRKKKNTPKIRHPHNKDEDEYIDDSEDENEYYGIDEDEDEEDDEDDKEVMNIFSGLDDDE